LYYSNPLTKGGIKPGMASDKMAAEEMINDKTLVWSFYQAVDGC
jgi:flavin-dependent dehydrogenase